MSQTAFEAVQSFGSGEVDGDKVSAVAGHLGQFAKVDILKHLTDSEEGGLGEVCSATMAGGRPVPGPSVVVHLGRDGHSAPVQYPCQLGKYGHGSGNQKRLPSQTSPYTTGYEQFARDSIPEVMKRQELAEFGVFYGDSKR